eukprot:scaffold130889_cov39-Phaeocystis_antarctica.AAC.1
MGAGPLEGLGPAGLVQVHAEVARLVIGHAQSQPLHLRLHCVEGPVASKVCGLEPVTVTAPSRSVTLGFICRWVADPGLGGDR